MKKIAITLIVSAFAFGVNAQQAPLLPKDQPLEKFRVLPDNSLSFKQLDSMRTKPAVKFNVMANTTIDNMPVARMQGNSNMPVVQTDNTAYNMPVAGMPQARIYTMKKPGANAEVLPFLGGKPPIYYELKKYPNNTLPADSSKK